MFCSAYTVTRRGPHKVLDVQNLLKSQRFFSINTECNVVRKRNEEKVFLLAELALDGKMFGKGDGLPDSAETPSPRYFCAMMYYDSRQGSLFSKASTVFFLNCLGDPSPS